MVFTKNGLFGLLLAVIALAGMFFVPGQSAEAAAAHKFSSFNYENYKENGRSWLRIEFGMTGKNVQYETSVRELTPKQLHVIVQDTAIGKIKTDYGLDRKIAKYLSIREDGNGNMDLNVSFMNEVADQAYKVYVADADKKAKKPYRLVIEIAADKLASEYEADIKNTPDSFDNLAGHKIVIDPGHGGSDSGARGHRGLLEKDAAFAISQNVADILRSSGAKVTMTRTTDVDVYGPNASATNELQARVDIGNADRGNEIFVSIHCDAFTNTTAHGTSTFYYAGSTRAQKLSELIHEEIVDETGLASRGARTARFYVLRNSNMPATLVETAFITNYAEEEMLGDADFQYRMAVAICRGISRYFDVY